MVARRPRLHSSRFSQHAHTGARSVEIAGRPAARHRLRCIATITRTMSETLPPITGNGVILNFIFPFDDAVERKARICCGARSAGSTRTPNTGAKRAIGRHCRGAAAGHLQGRRVGRAGGKFGPLPDARRDGRARAARRHHADSSRPRRRRRRPLRRPRPTRTTTRLPPRSPRACERRRRSQQRRRRRRSAARRQLPPTTRRARNSRSDRFGGEARREAAGSGAVDGGAGRRARALACPRVREPRRGRLAPGGGGGGERRRRYGTRAAHLARRLARRPSLLAGAKRAALAALASLELVRLRAESRRSHAGIKEQRTSSSRGTRRSAWSSAQGYPAHSRWPTSPATSTATSPTWRRRRACACMRSRRANRQLSTELKTKAYGTRM